MKDLCMSMLTTVVFIMANWNKDKCLTIGDWLK